MLELRNGSSLMFEFLRRKKTVFFTLFIGIGAGVIELTKELLLEVKRLGWKKALLFVIVLGIGMGVCEAVGRAISPYFDWIVNYGFLGVFFGALAVNATILTPAPFGAILLPFAISLAHQHHYGYFTVAVAYAGGAACGEMTGYLLARFGRKLVFRNEEKEDEGKKRNFVRRLQTRIQTTIENGFNAATKQGLFKRIEKWLAKHKGLAVFILSLQPVIPFDLAGIAAGSAKYTWWKFLLFDFLGRIPKYLIMFIIGIESSNLLSWIWHSLF